MAGKFAYISWVDWIGHIDESHRLSRTNEGKFPACTGIRPSPDIVDIISRYFQILFGHTGKQVHTFAWIKECLTVCTFYACSEDAA